MLNFRNDNYYEHKVVLARKMFADAGWGDLTSACWNSPLKYQFFIFVTVLVDIIGFTINSLPFSFSLDVSLLLRTLAAVCLACSTHAGGAHLVLWFMFHMWFTRSRRAFGKTSIYTNCSFVVIVILCSSRVYVPPSECADALRCQYHRINLSFNNI